MTLTQNYPQLKKIPQWLTTLLVILLGITLAKLLWMFLTPTESIAAQAPTSPSSVISKPKKQQNYGKIIADQHLFGKVEKKAVASTAPKTVDAPPPVVAAKLNIKLHGIMSYNKKTSGYALLSFNGQAQKVYAVDDSLDKDNKITISDVTAEKVVISNHGKLEEFFLPRTATINKGVAIPANAMIKTNIAPNNPHSPMAAVAPAPASIPFMPKAGIQKPNKADAPSIKNMAEFREKVMADPSKLLEIATAEPFTKDGSFLGFRVRPGKQRRFFRQLGLRNGDVVKEVNGILMDSAEKGLMLMSEISGASDLNITVLRGTRDVQLPTLHF